MTNLNPPIRMAGFLLAAAVSVTAAGVACVAAQASQPSSSLGIETKKVSFGPGHTTWTVPDGVTSVTAELYGAQGGSAGNYYANYEGGKGGYTKARFSVTPGDTVYVNVGGRGGNGIFGGGFNGGGPTRSYGGGGGGGSSIVVQGNMIVVGGGGGTGSYALANSMPDWSNGGGDGGGGKEAGRAGSGPDGCAVGNGGTASEGGKGGNCSGTETWDGGPAQGAWGGFYSGGGGGGYFGGGGGAFKSQPTNIGGGGGGGSAFAFANATIIEAESGNKRGDGEINISY